MKVAHTILAAVLASLSFGVAADPHKDESGHGKHRHGKSEYKHEYEDGNCKVKVKQKHGEYKEERKCKGGHPHVVYAPQPVYVPAPVEPGVVIHGTVRVH